MSNIKNKELIFKGILILIILISLITFLQLMKNSDIDKPKSYFIDYSPVIYSDWSAYEFYRDNSEKEWRFITIKKSSLTGEKIIKSIDKINFLDCFNKIKTIRDTISIEDIMINQIDAYCVKEGSMDIVSLKGIML